MARLGCVGLDGGHLAGLLIPRLKNRLHNVLDRAAYHLPQTLEQAVHANLRDWILQKQLLREGREFRFNIRARERFLLDDYEQPVANWLARNVRPGDHCMDVGAHVGSLTMIMALCAGPNGQVDAIEPLPRNWELLRRNIADNKVSNVTGHLACCWSASLEIQMFAGATSFESSLSQDFGIGASTVTATTIDKLADGKRIDLIKIDVEGAEAEVLLGAKALLKRCRPKLIVEIHPGLRGANAPTVPDVLSPSGYKAFRLDGEAIDFMKVDVLSRDRSLEPLHFAFLPDSAASQ